MIENEEQKIDREESVVDRYNKVASEYAYATAKEKGYRVVLPEPSQLFIDIDNEEDYQNFYLMFELFIHFEPAAFVESNTPSPSGEENHRHIIVDIGRDVTTEERCYLQACLGSDRKRELLAWRRIKNQDPNPTLFFEKSEKK